jgi:hypothetical protein
MTFPGEHFARFTGAMFIRDEDRLAVSFGAASTALAHLARRGWLRNASEAAYRAGTDGPAGYAAPGSAPITSRLVAVHFRELIPRRGAADLALRWEADGPGGPFPALDADITLSPAGKHATTLVLAGVYRIPPGDAGDGPDRAIVRRIAGDTIQTFLRLMAAAITAPAPGAERDGGTAGGGDLRPPASQAP